MPKYNVLVRAAFSISFDVEAETEEDAYQAAGKLSRGVPCNRWELDEYIDPLDGDVWPLTGDRE